MLLVQMMVVFQAVVRRPLSSSGLWANSFDLRKEANFPSPHTLHWNLGLLYFPLLIVGKQSLS